MTSVVAGHGAVVVTGAASGVGRVTALRLAEAGVDVVAVDVSVDALDAVATTFPDRISAHAGDVTDPGEVDAIVTTACEAAGGIAGLVNNAAIMDGLVPADECDDELWERILAVNLSAPFRLCRRVLPVMLTQGYGSIVNISSVAGIRGGRGGVSYTVAKHGMIGLTRSIAANYGEDGVRCNAVCPGGIATGIGVRSGGTRSDRGARTFDRIAPKGWGHVAEPDEITDVILFLLSPASRNMNGAVVVADGGWTPV